VLSRICETGALHEDEAADYVADPYKGAVDHPFSQEPGEERGRKRKKEPTAKGIFTPKHSRGEEKFSSQNMPGEVKNFLDDLCDRENLFENLPNLKESCKNLVGFSLAKSTWKRYGTALKWLKKFRTETGNRDLGWNEQEKLEFLCWAGRYTSLKPPTISMYFSAINRVFDWAGGTKVGGSELLRRSVLKGLKNQRARKEVSMEKSRKFSPVTLKILARVRTLLKEGKYSDLTKQSLRTACLISFWGCFRLGEILCKRKENFDRLSNLTWADVKFGKKVVKIIVKSPKTGKLVWVSMGKVEMKRFCPVKNVKTLKTLLCSKNMFKDDLPVFRMGSGRNVRPRDLVHLLKLLNLRQSNYSGKSFRAGVPNELLKNPGLFCKDDVKKSGRWQSRAYHTYLRESNLDLDLFHKVAKVLLNSVSHCS
jgi:hypothetical protein